MLAGTISREVPFRAVGEQTRRRMDRDLCSQGPDPRDSIEQLFAPVDNLPTINLVKAGSAVPVTFNL